MLDFFSLPIIRTTGTIILIRTVTCLESELKNNRISSLDKQSCLIIIKLDEEEE
jgi:hypothetical protein